MKSKVDEDAFPQSINLKSSIIELTCESRCRCIRQTFGINDLLGYEYLTDIHWLTGFAGRALFELLVYRSIKIRRNNLTQLPILTTLTVN